MVLDDMETYLTSGGCGTAGTDMFFGSMPPTPDTALAVYEAGGLPPLHTMGNTAGQASLETVTLQFMARAKTYAAARALLQKAFLKVDGFPKRTVNGVQYYYGRARQSPFLMGKDERDRFQVVFNADIMKDLSSTS